MEHNFKNGDRVKVISHLSPFIGLTGIVSSISGNRVVLTFENSHGQPSAIQSEWLKAEPYPKLRDRVRVTQKTGKWTAQEGEVVGIGRNEVEVDLDDEIVNFDMKDVEVIESFGPRRVEGAAIRPADIKVGDEIRVTRVSGGMTSTRQGVVGKAQTFPGTRHKNPYLFNVLNDGYIGARLNWNEEGETYTLVRAAPEVDKVLEALKGAKGGTAAYFNGHMARKSGLSDWWDIYSTSGLIGRSTAELREMIGANHLQLLVPEGS